MKKPSRFMPQAQSNRNGPTAIISLAILATVSTFIFYTWPIQSLSLVVVVVAASWVITFFDRRHFQALARQRIHGPRALCTFARAFDYRTIDTWVIRAVYEELQGVLSNVKAFPLYRTDRLIDDLKLDGDDLSFEVGQRISQRTGRTLENTTSNPFYNKVESVGDLVHFFNAQPFEGGRPNQSVDGTRGS